MCAIWSLALEWDLFGVNSLIELPFGVIAEYFRFHGAISLHNLSLECGLFEAGFISGIPAAKSV